MREREREHHVDDVYESSHWPVAGCPRPCTATAGRAPSDDFGLLPGVAKGVEVVGWYEKKREDGSVYRPETGRKCE